VTGLTLPVNLAAAAERLRQENSAPWHYGGRPGEFAVADLIDGIMDDLFQAAGVAAHPATDEAVETLERVLRERVAPLVRAFLPDWNPDTEETP
jgi:hypothetical protein